MTGREPTTSIDRRTVLKAAAASATGSVALTGSAGASRASISTNADEDTLRFGLSSSPIAFDPVDHHETTSTMVSDNLFYERPFVRDDDGIHQPWLVSDWDVLETNTREVADYEDYMIPEDEQDPDQPALIEHEIDDEPHVLTHDGAQDAVEADVFGMEIELTFRDDIEFHDNSTLDASNLAGSYERYFGGFEEMLLRDWFLDAEVDEEDDLRCRVYAQFIDADVIDSLNIPIFPDAHLDLGPGEIDPREDDAEDPIGSAPYEFESWENGALTAVRFEDHWFDPDEIEWDIPDDFPEEPPVETLEVHVIGDDTDRKMALDEGALDVTYDFDSETLEYFHGEDHFDVQETQSAGFTFCSYPTQVEPWDNSDLRRAVNHLIERDFIAEEIFGGWVDPAWTRLPEITRHIGTEDYDDLEDDLKSDNEYDPDEAVSILEALESAGEIDPPIDIQLEVNADNDERVEMVHHIRDAMEATGYFNTTIAKYPWQDYLDRLNDPDYPDFGHIFFVGLSGGFSPDGPARSLHHSDRSGTCCNFNGYADDDVDQEIDDARFDDDVLGDDGLDERRERYDDLWQTLADERPTSITHFDKVVAAFSTAIEGFEPAPTTPRLLGDTLFAPARGVVVEIDRPDPTVEDYADEETDVVELEGVMDAVSDWRAGIIDTSMLQDVVDYWRTGDEVS